ncbi:glycosyltransferase [Taibaiella lutea]|uniref:Glycosyltransferase n=1 Tax=Taibaiella lutea TaxID=2608001 RepID=A0A5M6CML5_9BACT|nr:glycosyltransferase [Taibaiella lutea]KAA5536246.1 glycosyltransferase [Taibaiella lutea]
MPDKKILIVGKNPPPYFGTTVWFQSLQNTLWPSEFEMLWFNNNIHSSFSTLGKLGFKSIINNIRLYNAFRTFIKKNKPDLILIPMSQATLGFIKDSIFIKIAKKNAPTLLMLHGANWINWLKKSSLTLNNYVRSTLKDTIGAIVLGENLKYLFEEFYKKDLIFSVPNGLDVDFITKNKSASDKMVITYLGNLQPSKGIKSVIEAACKLQEANINYHLKVIGQWRDEETKEYCESLVKSNSLSVKFYGPLYDAAKLEELYSSDIFLFPPNMPEGHPIVLIEAMAAGLPIIATNQGAISESVTNGENGYIVESNNPVQIAEKLIYLYENPLVRKQMGFKSQEKYIEAFTSAKMIQNFSKVFNQILQKK